MLRSTVRPRHRLASPRSCLAAAIATGLLTLTACGDDGDADSGDAAAEGFPVTVENCGREVTIDQPPERLYVIGGEAGTLVHAAGGTDRISTFAPLTGEPLGDAAGPLGEREQAPIQTATDITQEAIIGGSPDLVVAFGLGDLGPEDLEAAGIPTLIISGYCGGFGAGQSEVQDPIEEIYADITTLGRVMDTEAQAERAVADLRDRVDAARERADQSPPPEATTAALFVPGPDGTLGSYGERSMIHQQMEYLGLSNVFAGTDERFFEPSTEALIEAAPERLIALYEPGDTSEQEVREALTSREELAEIPAVAEEEILVLDFFHSGHGTLAVDGLEALADQLGR
ncbi:ABC transporter substrate-binding protein [Streptomyces litchfieldiae]|uniref:ABC transporter substrate-binding protein n=1 Tax=Streptomyces litchfieldiae TaxID=3075543 RepID=A0ABU2MW74_9ACTN|nr:ABC transporter substrate-binding protein [Streptomyces sp. DSM 44938]MDT0345721.1 ABC transporter substrate-binding protein [Streptomyces sp. DSM 44938]